MDVVGTTDPIFCAAFFYFLQERGWTVQEFCEQTKRLSADGRSRLLHPSSVSDWKKRTHPSNQNVIITCLTLEVSRAEFFQVGEELERMRLERIESRQRQRISREKDLEAMKEMVASFRRTDDLDGLAELERTLREQRSRLEELVDPVDG